MSRAPQVMARLAELQESMTQYAIEHRGDAAIGLEVLPGVVEVLKRLQKTPVRVPAAHPLGRTLCARVTGVPEAHAAPGRRQNVLVGLVTGNLEPMGWIKMEAMGLLPLFSSPRFGGFGSDYCSGNTAESWRDRAEFIRWSFSYSFQRFITVLRAESPMRRRRRYACETRHRTGDCLTVCTAHRAANMPPIGRRFHIGDAPTDIQAAVQANVCPIGVTTGIFSSTQLRQCVPKGADEPVVLDGLADIEGVLRVLQLDGAL
jgi:phosphoglycolate phosphatase